MIWTEVKLNILSAMLILIRFVKRPQNRCHTDLDTLPPGVYTQIPSIIVSLVSGMPKTLIYVSSTTHARGKSWRSETKKISHLIYNFLLEWEQTRNVCLLWDAVLLHFCRFYNEM